MNIEAGLIERFFGRLGAARTDVSLGVGDDAALLEVPAGQQLVLTTDALVEGVHFLPGADPRSLGHRALAVNLSDVAAMGATPAWALLSLNLPVIEESWLAQFAAGFDALARQHEVALVGGNMSRGPLSITVQAAGLVARGTALQRSTARAGDLLCVSGTVGDAAAGRTLQSAELRQRFEFPTPRIALGAALRVATSFTGTRAARSGATRSNCALSSSATRAKPSPLECSSALTAAALGGSSSRNSR